MQIFRELAGYSFGRADIVRRAMSKKKHEVMRREREAFLHGETAPDGTVICDGAIARGVDPKVAEEIYDDVALFSSYAFNKSHAAAYTVVAYQTAYLKCHYPKEYMAALLSSVLASGGKVNQYSNECARLGISILPPDVNESELTFTVAGDHIRFGLLAIKNLGAGIIRRMIECRKEAPFTSVYDFCKRMHGRDFNRRAFEGLIKSGALDSLGANRRQMLQAIDVIMDAAEQEADRNAGGQTSLFDDFDMGESGTDVSHLLPNVSEMPLSELLAMEKEATGLYLSGHPLKEYDAAAKRLRATATTAILEHEVGDGEKVSLIVLINEVKTKTTKKGDLMAFLTVEDKLDSIGVTVFPATFAKCRPLIAVGKIVVLHGRVTEMDDRPSEIVCDRIEPAVVQSVPVGADYGKLYLRLPTFDRALLDQISVLLSDHGAEVIIYCEDTKRRFKAAKFADFPKKSLKWQKICDFLGENNIKAVE